MIDVVFVIYNEVTLRQAWELCATLTDNPLIGEIVTVDNRRENRGFAKACNLGAQQCESEIIAFLNPDVVIDGDFAAIVEETFATNADVMICGNRFGKPQDILNAWAVQNWVCGACFFVRREWFEQIAGFDPQFVWSFEETDLIRRTELAGKRIAELNLPIQHSSPEDDAIDVVVYKAFHLHRGWQLYKLKHRILP